ncbi:Ig-like domain-containing protein [Caballeronia sordidicola]|uniref:T1SS secreted agglutinin RTX n=1 Tax=Caballeronia sordidicola TaxID=196367 RepID=A0A242MEM8_CABSO|nr:Ig-like domain-containing protein [Caballeronia sordidicola]OTP69193.1 T1SS secreted agglutinin RTX [Caballeronia sordidicola]
MKSQTSSSSVPVLNASGDASEVPSPPVIIGLIDNVGPVQGMVAWGSTIDDASPTMTGTGQPGEVITLLDELFNNIGSAVVAQDGTWSVQSQVALSNGSHTLNVKATNAAGATSHESDQSITFFVDTTVPSPPVVLGLIDHVGPVQGIVSWGSSIDDASPTMYGTGQSGQVITLLDESFNSIGSTVVSQDGTWSVQSQVALSSGMHTLNVKATNAAGVTSHESDQSISFFVNTTALKSVLLGSDASDHSNAASATGLDAISHNADTTLSPGQPAVLGETTNDASAAPLISKDYGSIDFASLVAKPNTSESGIADAKISIGDHANLKLSLVDVLNTSEHNLYQNNDKQLLMITGNEGATNEPSAANVPGPVDSEWQQHNIAQVVGVTHYVYEHFGTHGELLVQQSNEIIVH